MGKSKKKKATERASRKFIEKKVKVNPFDLVGGKKNLGKVGSTKSTPSSAAVSRKRAIEARKNTIGIEYRHFGRANQIVDHRIAERNSKLSAVEKAEKRFLLQRKSLYSKNRFNLGDDGDSSIDLNKRKGLRTNKHVNQEDEDCGELGADLVALANFGGGTFDGQTPGGAKSYKSKRSEMLANLIAQSKQSKAVRQMEKEAQLDKLDSLDALFVELSGNGNFGTTASVSEDKAKSSMGDDNSYESLYKTLQFEDSKRAQPSVPTKKVLSDVVSTSNTACDGLRATNVASGGKVDDDGPDEQPLQRLDVEKEPDFPAEKPENNKTKRRRKSMKQILRKETRGAMKELKKDAIYLARLQGDQRLKTSRERNEKTKRILRELQGQESEYMKRKLKQY